MKKIAEIINEFNGSMTIEGMSLTNANKKECANVTGIKNLIIAW